ncbi:sensor histidine kinase [Alloacidobacterium dinghuense]|uniref:Sensor histidine kinase n=2 Tax=Alloacidobacterium dinghuense TaxID=2763107 RepID=A0A7G8BQJ8_9BACT|nr:sensor histidine kinase [Alloacidobacterium dinghuense]
MPLGVWHSIASGCEKIGPEDANEALRIHTVPGSAKPRRDGWPDKNRLYDYVWLVYSVFFFIEPIARHNLRYWLQFAGAYGLFLVIYSGLVHARTKTQSYLLLSAMCVLGLAYLPINNSACGMLVYVAAFIPFISDSLAVVAGTIAFVCAAVAIEGYFLQISPWAWGFPAFFCVVVGGTNLLTSQKIRSKAKLQLAQEEIEQLAKLAERERIARDLHDVLGHTLSVIVLKSELAGRLFERDPERARQEIGEVEQVSRKALSEVREAIRGYRSEGLAAEIERAHRTLDAAGVTLTCESKPPSLSAAEETVIALAVREAVTNIVRHAQASQCRMKFVSEKGRTSLTVEDDGRGNIRQEGNGLRGMRERIESLGGHFSIDGNQGTRINIDIPVRSA